VRWYLRYSLSLRDVEELFAERGLEVDHRTIWRWVQRYGSELELRLRPRSSRPTNPGASMRHIFESLTVGVTLAIYSTGATINLLPALRDAEAAKQLCRQALSDPSHAAARHKH
jgi:IS6 family transposase